MTERLLTRGRRRTPTVILCALALTTATIAIPATVGPASPAAAATIPVGSILANVSDHHGTDGGNDSSNCIRYSPTSTSTSSGFVGSTGEALTAHGYSGSCPSALTTSTQSAVGVKPATATTAQDGVPFLIARVTHYNNPISAAAAHFSGNFTVRLGGFDTTPDLTFGWSMWETPNDSDCDFTGPNVPNQNGCADQIIFTGQVASQTLTQNGVTYKLVMKGFSPTSGTCPATQPANTQTQFLTAEKATSVACLYASLVQLRSLSIVKRIVAPPGVTPPATAFVFDGASSVAGSAWDDNSFSLTPTLGTTPTFGPRELLQADTVSVTERVPASDKWSLTSVTCMDGAGQPVNATVNLAARRMTLADVAAPSSTAAGPITCTYTNTYTPKATLTLVKAVDGGVAQASKWTLSANGPTPISGPSGSAAVTRQPVVAGTYQLDEAGSPLGYTSQGWTCTAGTLNGTALTLVDNNDATCTVTNRFSRNTFRIVKEVQGPAGGFTGTGDTAFTGSWVCGVLTGSFSVTQNTPFTSPEIPAGSTCTVTETQPTGNLADSSWSWNAPTYPNGNTVTVAEGTVPTVAVRNTFAQSTGALTLGKVVEPRAGAPVAGYTGGDRTFPLAYDCRIGGNTVASGTLAVSAGTTATATGIPATAVCALSEVLTQQPGDFADPSLAWDGTSWSSTSVTIADGGTSSATATNFFTKQTASLILAKVVDGEGYTGGSGANFTVGWDCGVASGSVTVARDGSETVTVPANTACSVTEAAPVGNLDAAHEWGAPTYAGLSSGAVSVPPSGSATVTVTNHTVPVFGTVSVTKALTGAVEGVRARTTFPVTVACDNPAQGESADFSDTFALSANVAQTTPNLPVGTSCTISEGALPALGLVDESYTWGPAPAPQTVTVDTKDTATAVTVTNRVDRAFGSLDVTKAVDALNGVDGSGTTFTGTWTCTTADETQSGTWSRTGAGPATMTGGADQVLLTSTCSITEDDPATSPSPGDPSYAWGAQVVSGPVTLTAANPQGTITVTNEVVRVTGTFAVSKVVEGGEPGTAFVDGDFTFTYSCTGDLLPTRLVGTVAVRAGQTTQVGTAIPAGSTCTIAESGRPDPITPYDWDDVSISPDTFTVNPAEPVSVRATNTISQRTVTATVRKSVDDPDGGFVGNPDFQLSLRCELGGVTTTYGPVAVKAGGTASFPGILVGSLCAPAEQPIPAGAGLADASYVWGLPTLSEEQRIEILGGSYVFTIANPVERAYGTLALSKDLDDPDHVVDPAYTYSGSWTCTHPGDADVTGTWSVSGPGPATLTGVPDPGILLASTCTPIEGALTAPPSASDPSYFWGEPVADAATTSADGAAAMTVHNTVLRSTGQVLVSKSVTGAADGYVSSGADFTVGFTCYLSDPASGGVSGSRDITAGEAPVVLADGIPNGWTCRVAESTPSQDLLRDRSYAWGAPVIDGVGADSTVTVDGAVTLTVTNPVVRLTGALSVVKQLGPTTPAGVVADDAPFSGTYSCQYGGAVVQVGTWSVAGTGPATLSPTADALPASTVCSATEAAPDDSGLVDASWSWGTPTVSDPVTIEAAGESGVVTVTNTPERVYAPLQVTKGFNGSAAALVPGAVVGGGWSCDYAGAQVEAGRWQLPAAGGSVLIARADGVVRGDNGPIRLPATAVCTVVEDTLSAADLVDASYAWGEPTYDPADGRVTLAAGAGNAVTITNTTTRVYGAFQITKSIGLAASLRRPGLQFEGTWTCTYNTDPSVDGTWQVTGEGTDVFSGILLGSVCSVREAGPAQSPSPDPSYVWDEAAIAPAAVTVTQGTTVSVGVTNPTHRVLTGLSVTKRLTGDTAGEPDGQTYALSYDCTDVSGGEHVGAASIANGDTWTTGAVIPVGSTCTVAEGDLPDVLPRDTWGPVVFSLTGPAEPPTTTGQSAAFTLFGPQEDPNATVQVTVTNTLLRQEAGYLVSKVADPPSGTTLTPGDTVTYTLTVTPTGPGTTTGVVVTDDLSGITPYAAVGSIVASQGTAVVSGDLQTLTWDVGTVSGTSPLTLTYQATVSAGAYGATLRNHVTATGEQPPTDCEPCTTENPVEAKWTLEKGSDPASGSTVEPGTAITYELTVTNRSTTSPLPAGTVVTDDLSAVLDHAAFVGLQGGFSGTAVLTGTRLVWTLPAVPANGVQHLRYVVHVDPGAGGVTLRNIATGVGVNDPSDDCSAPTARLSSFAVAAASPCSRVTTHETPAGSGGGGGEVVPEEPTGSGPGSSLAFTGTGPVEAFAILGMLLIGAGVAVLRRRSRPSSID